jgi:hypothetical protein
MAVPWRIRGRILQQGLSKVQESSGQPIELTKKTFWSRVGTTMKELLTVLKEYFKGRRVPFIVILLSFCIFGAVFSLYSLPLEAIGYAALLTVLFILACSILDFLSFYKRHQSLGQLKKGITLANLALPEAKNLMEKDYQELILLLMENRNTSMLEKDRIYREMMDYYTVWAHQIKTPIAAMRLVLQAEANSTGSELQEQLFRIEQYADMVLQYLRTEELNADLVIKSYPLDAIVRQAVRKYSKIFIRKRIKLNYEAVNQEVLTDEKWLCFVLEQILSNALKYTNVGEIFIYMDGCEPKTLVIEDTGIGIEQEDLHRIFEKGFTGYNGRIDKKSTGIGLYLCKRILDKLSHTITAASTPGRGTRIMIGFPRADIADD